MTISIDKAMQIRTLNTTIRTYRKTIGTWAYNTRVHLGYNAKTIARRCAMSEKTLIRLEKGELQKMTDRISPLLSLYQEYGVDLNPIMKALREYNVHTLKLYLLQDSAMRTDRLGFPFHEYVRMVAAIMRHKALTWRDIAEHPNRIITGDVSIDSTIKVRLIHDVNQWLRKREYITEHHIQCNYIFEL